MSDMFLGKPIGYWIELQKEIDIHPCGHDIERLIESNAYLRAKVSRYEEYIDELNRYRLSLVSCRAAALGS